jgi:hypothetical protein
MGRINVGESKESLGVETLPPPCTFKVINPTGSVTAWPKTLPAASRVALKMEREVLNFMTVETVQ